MTLVVDISCPECGRTDPVQKEGIATYRCTACEFEFSQEDVEP